MIKLVAFGECGEERERGKGLCTRGHVINEGGLRIGLPPDNVAKVRIDYVF